MITLAGVPLAAVLLSLISAKTQSKSISQVEHLAKASKLARTTISAMETVKCLGGQKFELRRHQQIIAKAARFYLAQAQGNGMQIGLVRFIILAMFVQGFWYGSYLASTGRKSPGDILTAFWAALMATQTVEQILPQMLVLEQGRAAGSALREMSMSPDQERRFSKIKGHLAPKSCEGDIELRNVSWSRQHPSDIC